MPKRAVFLDRDKTIIADPGYIDDPDLVSLLPGAAGSIRANNNHPASRAGRRGNGRHVEKRSCTQSPFKAKRPGLGPAVPVSDPRV